MDALTRPPARQAECAAFVHYDTTKWPLVRAVFNPIAPTDAEFDAHMACFEELLKRNSPFYIMFDIRNASSVSKDQLKRQAALMKTLEREVVRNLVCSSIVLTGFLLRGLLEFFFLFYRPKKENQRFSDDMDAQIWMETEWYRLVAASQAV